MLKAWLVSDSLVDADSVVLSLTVDIWVVSG